MLQVNFVGDFCDVDIFKHSRQEVSILLTKFKQISIFWANIVCDKKKTSCSSTLLILWTDNSETLRK